MMNNVHWHHWDHWHHWQHEYLLVRKDLRTKEKTVDTFQRETHLVHQLLQYIVLHISQLEHPESLLEGFWMILGPFLGTPFGSWKKNITHNSWGPRQFGCLLTTYVVKIVHKFRRLQWCIAMLECGDLPCFLQPGFWLLELEPKINECLYQYS